MSCDPCNPEDVARITTPGTGDFSKASIEEECRKKYANPELFAQLQRQYEYHLEAEKGLPGAPDKIMSSIEILDMYRNRHKKNWYDADDPDADHAAVMDAAAAADAADAAMAALNGGQSTAETAETAETAPPPPVAMATKDEDDQLRAPVPADQ